jgi:ATP-dependent DNA helicase RecG
MRITKKMIISFITEYGSASRKDIDNLLLDKLSDASDDYQATRNY